jgi:hypothetical protein
VHSLLVDPSESWKVKRLAVEYRRNSLLRAHAAERFSQLEVDDGNVWFGGFTSAVQLADTYVKLATCAVDLFSRVRDAPETIQKRIVVVEQLLEIVRLIQHNPSLQTPLIASVLTRARADADQLFEILTKIDAQPSAGKVVKYWKALEGITREKRILAICDRLQENKALLTLYIASINS